MDRSTEYAVTYLSEFLTADTGDMAVIPGPQQYGNN